MTVDIIALIMSGISIVISIIAVRSNIKQETNRLKSKKCKQVCRKSKLQSVSHNRYYNKSRCQFHKHKLIFKTKWNFILLLHWNQSREDLFQLYIFEMQEMALCI